MTHTKKGQRKNRTKNKKEKQTITQEIKNFIKRKQKEGDKSILNRIEYKKNGIAKTGIKKLTHLSPQKINSPNSNVYIKKNKKHRAKIRIDKKNWRIIKEGTDYITLNKRKHPVTKELYDTDLLAMYKDYCNSQGTVFKNVFG